MSRERAPAMQAKSPADQMRSAVLKNTPIIKGEHKDNYGSRLKEKFQSALDKMGRKQEEWVNGRSKYLPHQGAKECIRRVKQLRSGAICNYVKGAGYET
jgi:hypothetical protein